MAKLKLTVACGDYEIVRALSDGTVQTGLSAQELVTTTGGVRLAMSDSSMREAAAVVQLLIAGEGLFKRGKHGMVCYAGVHGDGSRTG